MEQLINDYGQLILGAVGVLLLFFAGNKDKAWEALKGLLEYFPGKKPVDPKPVDAPVNLEPLLPPVDGTSMKFSFPELYNRFKDGIQREDWIWLLSNAIPLVIWLLPLILEKGKAEVEKISQQEQKK